MTEMYALFATIGLLGTAIALIHDPKTVIELTLGACTGVLLIKLIKTLYSVAL